MPDVQKDISIAAIAVLSSGPLDDPRDQYDNCSLTRILLTAAHLIKAVRGITTAEKCQRRDRHFVMVDAALKPLNGAYAQIHLGRVESTGGGGRPEALDSTARHPHFARDAVAPLQNCGHLIQRELIRRENPMTSSRRDHLAKRRPDRPTGNLGRGTWG